MAPEIWLSVQRDFFPVAAMQLRHICWFGAFSFLSFCLHLSVKYPTWYETPRLYICAVIWFNYSFTQVQMVYVKMEKDTSLLQLFPRKWLRFPFTPASITFFFFCDTLESVRCSWIEMGGLEHTNLSPFTVKFCFNLALVPTPLFLLYIICLHASIFY